MFLPHESTNDRILAVINGTTIGLLDDLRANITKKKTTTPMYAGASKMG